MLSFNGDLLQKDLCQHAVAPRTVVVSALTLRQATVDPRLHQRLLDTHRQVWLSLLLAQLMLDSKGTTAILGIVDPPK